MAYPRASTSSACTPAAGRRSVGSPSRAEPAVNPSPSAPRPRGGARRRARAVGLALAWILAAGPAHAVQVTCGNASGLAGQTIDVTVSTSSLTGAGVVALQFALQFNANILTPTAILESGTLTGAAAWNNATFSVQPPS